MQNKKIIVADCETSGLWNRKEDYKHPSQPNIVSLCAHIYNDKREIINELNVIIKPEGYTIPVEASNIHGITTEMAMDLGVNRKAALQMFISMLSTCNLQVGHNYQGYDLNVLKANISRVSDKIEPIQLLDKIPIVDTQLVGTDLCKLPGKYGSYKWPKLMELHKFLFNEEFSGAHGAKADVLACAKCYYRMVDDKVI